nr:MAG TPA_asm: hypothetical protein [Caudoviricetes sp.]
MDEKNDKPRKRLLAKVPSMYSRIQSEKVKMRISK